ncbi:MAG: hypothetical protein IJR82_00605 [Bacilli bacterium]|nr:hypothetical protein [Bacilli bacterium]
MDIIRRIGTINMQNSKVNRKGDITAEGVDNSAILADYIKSNSYYFLGTQV